MTIGLTLASLSIFITKGLRNINNVVYNKQKKLKLYPIRKKKVVSLYFTSLASRSEFLPAQRYDMFKALHTSLNCSNLTVADDKKIFIKCLKSVLTPFVGLYAFDWWFGIFDGMEGNVNKLIYLAVFQVVTWRSKTCHTMYLSIFLY